MSEIWTKDYEVVHDRRKISLHRSTSYDEFTGHLLHTPNLEREIPVIFPSQDGTDYFPPMLNYVSKENWLLGDRGARRPWYPDGYIEDGLRADQYNKEKVSDRCVILCLLLFLAVVFGMLYMLYRLLKNGWMRYRRYRNGSQVQDATRDCGWGKWIASVFSRVGGSGYRYHWERFSGRRMRSEYPV